jgi:hypothetical protein
VLTRELNRRRRGVAMISTTVLTIIAVSLALTIASQALSATRTESSRLDTSHARAAALEGLIGVEQNLAIDPFYLYAVVGSDEAARVCKLGDNRVPPGCLMVGEQHRCHTITSHLHRAADDGLGWNRQRGIEVEMRPIEAHTHPIEPFGEREWDRDKMLQSFGGTPMVLRAKNDPNGAVAENIAREDCHRTVEKRSHSRR